MDMEGVDLQDIVDACQRQNMRSILEDHIHRFHQALHVRRKYSSIRNQPQGSNPTLGVHTNKLKSQKENPHDDKRKGHKSNLKFL